MPRMLKDMHLLKNRHDITLQMVLHCPQTRDPPRVASPPSPASLSTTPTYLPSVLPPHPFFQVLMLARPSCQLLPEAASACGKLTCSPRPHWSPASSHLIIDSYIYLENSKINITNSGCLWEVPYLFQFICVDNAGIF